MPAYKDTTTGKWFCKFYYETNDGKRKQKLKRGFDLKRQAEQFERDFLKQYNHENTILLSDLAAVYLQEMEKDHAITTVVSSRARLSLLLDHFGDRPAVSITTANINELLPELEQKYKLNTRATVLRVWNALFSYGVKRYNLPFNPVSSISKPTERTTDGNFWTLEQFKTFKACADPSLCLIAAEIIYYTGLRHGELLGLTVSDIDLINNKLTVNATRDTFGRRAPKTKTSRRVVYLAPYVTGLFADIISALYNREPETLLFPLSTNTLNKYLQRNAEAAGLPIITVHGLRHSHASLLANNNASLHAISDRLGHSSPVITANIYTHMFNEKRQALAEDLQKIIDENK